MAQIGSYNSPIDINEDGSITIKGSNNILRIESGTTATIHQGIDLVYADGLNESCYVTIAPGVDTKIIRLISKAEQNGFLIFEQATNSDVLDPPNSYLNAPGSSDFAVREGVLYRVGDEWVIAGTTEYTP